MSDFLISKSLIQSYWDYVKGDGCGLLFEASRLIKAVETETSKEAKLGHMFEYLATGEKPRDGSTPIPETRKNGELIEAYKRVEEQANKFKEYLPTMGIEILETGTRLEKNGIEGTLDIIANYKRRKVVIDLKYTGLLYDEWHKMGWGTKKLEFNPEKKEYMMIQPRVYTYLSGLPFYYFLFSSTPDQDARFFRIIISDDDKENLEIEIERIKNEIEDIQLFGGFKPRPSLKRCKECPKQLSSRCPFKTEVPLEEEPIEYTKTA